MHWPCYLSIRSGKHLSIFYFSFFISNEMELVRCIFDYLCLYFRLNFRIPLLYFVLLKRHQEIISCPDAIKHVIYTIEFTIESKHEVDTGNPTIGHLMFLIEAYKVCYDSKHHLLFHSSLHLFGIIMLNCCRPNIGGSKS